MSDDPRDEGCLCQRCTRRYKVDLMVDDEIWNRIHQSFNLLCPICIVMLLENENQFAYYDLRIPID